MPSMSTQDPSDALDNFHKILSQDPLHKPHSNPQPKVTTSLNSSVSMSMPLNSFTGAVAPESQPQPISSFEVSLVKSSLSRKRPVAEVLENSNSIPFKPSQGNSVDALSIGSPALDDPVISRGSQLVREEIMRQKMLTDNNAAMGKASQLFVQQSHSVTQLNQVPNVQTHASDGEKNNLKRLDVSEGQLTTSDEQFENKIREKAKDESANISGYIFFCNLETEKECYQLKLFGSLKKELETVKKIQPGTHLFLFNLHTKLLHGIFQATCRGGYFLDPVAFKRCYPAQVRIKRIVGCRPLQERVIKPAILSNYDTNSNKFHPILNENQVNDLLKIFLKHKISEIPLRNVSIFNHKLPHVNQTDVSKSQVLNNPSQIKVNHFLLPKSKLDAKYPLVFETARSAPVLKSQINYAELKIDKLNDSLPSADDAQAKSGQLQETSDQSPSSSIHITPHLHSSSLQPSLSHSSSSHSHSSRSHSSHSHSRSRSQSHVSSSHSRPL